MEDITVENANDMMAKAKISDTTYTKQAAAWVIVNQFCYQSGLFHNREKDDLSGIQRVIKYLSETQSENKALREENLRLQNRVSSLENIAEMDRKTEYQYNQLYKEKEALRDQLEACEQHNKILCEQMEELLKEIERLKINQPPFR